MQVRRTLSFLCERKLLLCHNNCVSPHSIRFPDNSSCCLQGDTRSPSSHLAWSVSADVEALAWDPFNPTHFLASSEDGIVAAFDARSGQGSKPLYRLSAHDKPTCCLSFNPAAKDLLATASTDKQVIAVIKYSDALL